MKWDGRALGAGFTEEQRVLRNYPWSHYQVVRNELFEPTATLKEVRCGVIVTMTWWWENMLHGCFC